MNHFDSPGGHIFVCLILIILGMGAAYQNIPHGSELVVFSLGVLSRSMVGSDKAPAKPKPPEGGE